MGSCISGCFKKQLQKTKNFLEGYEESGLCQHVKIKTFQKKEGELTNTLDLIFTVGENRIDHIDSSPPLGG